MFIKAIVKTLFVNPASDVMSLEILKSIEPREQCKFNLRNNMTVVSFFNLLQECVRDRFVHERIDNWQKPD